MIYRIFRIFHGFILPVDIHNNKFKILPEKIEIAGTTVSIWVCTSDLIKC